MTNATLWAAQRFMPFVYVAEVLAAFGLVLPGSPGCFPG